MSQRPSESRSALPVEAADAIDADLLRAYVRSRDDLAFGRLAARHGRALRRIAWRHTRNEAAAEDVAQAALIVLSRRPKPALRSAKRRGSALPWLAKVARYAAENWHRAESRRKTREQAAARPAAGLVGDPPGSRDLAEAVTAALATLPRRQRRLITLHYIDGHRCGRYCVSGGQCIGYVVVRPNGVPLVQGGQLSMSRLVQR